MNKYNYEFMCELGLSVVNGVLVDQDTNEMVKNNYTGKYIIDYIEGTYANWKYYENYDRMGRETRPQSSASGISSSANGKVQLP